MARLQILQLPEGPEDERPPFALVIDQATEATAQSLALQEDRSPLESALRHLSLSLAEQIGARAVLCFDETINIPANDTTAYLNGPWNDPQRIQAEIHDTLSSIAQGATHARDTYRDRRPRPYVQGSYTDVDQNHVD